MRALLTDAVFDGCALDQVYCSGLGMLNDGGLGRFRLFGVVVANHQIQLERVFLLVVAADAAYCVAAAEGADNV